ncbi:methyltransferase type 11 [Xylariomycetidae sp. FL2044]|nr:methyltransferase type 11 [Xylariomycetidae sp. FL2044]
MEEDPKNLVQRTYDHIASWYLSWVEGQRSPREQYTAKVLDHVPAASSSSPLILELGCGPGVPVTRMLLDRGARVVGNDISAAQLGLARARCPEATFVEGDMSSAAALSFDAASLDGAVSFFALFHLPRAEQRAMLRRVQGWLRPGAAAAFNLATVDEAEIHGEFLGHGMFWSSYGVDESLAMVRDAGLDVVEASTREAGDDGQLREDDPDYGVKFLWVVARKAPLGEKSE